MRLKHVDGMFTVVAVEGGMFTRQAFIDAISFLVVTFA